MSERNGAMNARSRLAAAVPPASRSHASSLSISHVSKLFRTPNGASMVAAGGIVAVGFRGRDRLIDRAQRLRQVDAAAPDRRARSADRGRASCR